MIIMMMMITIIIIIIIIIMMTIIIIMGDRVGSSITRDLDWNTLFCGFGSDKDRLHFKLYPLKMTKKKLLLIFFSFLFLCRIFIMLKQECTTLITDHTAL